MDSTIIYYKLIWIFIFIISFLCITTFSDMGKMSSPQNLFGSILQSQFITRNNSKIVAQKGGLAILPCVVKLNSPATVSWIRRKDFQLLTVGLSTHSSDKRFLVEHTRHMGHWSLRIKSVREEDRGLYECQLSIYPTQSIMIELKVVEAIAEIVGSPDLHIDEGSSLKLDCKLKRATENPAFVFWYHNNKMVNYDAPGGFFVTSSAKLLPSLLISNISINKIDFSHSKIESSYQYLPLTMTLLPTPPPFPLTISTSILTIQEVHFQHAGNYTCAPSNARSASITVHVLSGEKPAAMQHANSSIPNDDSSNNSITISRAPSTTKIDQISLDIVIVIICYRILYKCCNPWFIEIVYWDLQPIILHLINIILQR